MGLLIVYNKSIICYAVPVMVQNRALSNFANLLSRSLAQVDPQPHSDITYLVIFTSQFFFPPAICVLQRWTVKQMESPYQTKNSDGVVCLAGMRQTCNQGVK